MYLLYRYDHSGEGFLAGGIYDGEFWAEVIEYGTVQVT